MVENDQREAMPLSSLGLLATLLNILWKRSLFPLTLVHVGSGTGTRLRHWRVALSWVELTHRPRSYVSCKDQWFNFGIIHQLNNMQGKVEDQLT